MNGTILPTELTISSAGGEISLFITVTLHDAITLTEMAPQKWALEFPGNSAAIFKLIIFPHGQTLWLPFNYDVYPTIHKIWH
jgi:hypothetical protein